MVGWLREGEETVLFPRAHPVRIADFPLLEVAFSPEKGEKTGVKWPQNPEKQGTRVAKTREKQGVRGAKLLRKQGVFRALMPEKWEEGAKKQGLFPVKALPLYRAMGERLCLKLLEDVPPRRRRVLLRGEGADANLRALANALCPQTALALELGKGGEELARQLQRDYGAPPQDPAWGEPPQVVVELGSPAENIPLLPGAWRLKLWGEPDLAGLVLDCPIDLPPDLPRDPFLALLWESGRLEVDQIGILSP